LTGRSKKVKARTKLEQKAKGLFWNDEFGCEKRGEKREGQIRI
jgi:hypothetical protein